MGEESNTLLLSFLVRIVTELTRNQSSSATVALINFNFKFDYVPCHLMQQVPAAIFITDLFSNNTQPSQFNVPLVLFAFHSPQRLSKHNSIHSSVLTLLQTYNLFDKFKKVVVVADSNDVQPDKLGMLAQTFSALGVIDVIYVLIIPRDLIIVRLDAKLRQFIPFSLKDSVEQLFPDELANLTGLPYRVAVYDDPPLAYQDVYTKQIVGIDVNFIDIIAKHQSTVAEYSYTPEPLKLSKLYKDNTIDFATYRLAEYPHGQPFSRLYFPNHHRYCLAVPKTYNRIFHEQLIWPYTIDLWLLIFGLFGFFLLYHMVLQITLLLHFPHAFRVIDTPLHLLRILLLFLLSEYYTAILTASLGQSSVPTYPRTLEAFAKSKIPLLISMPNSFPYVQDHSEVLSRIIEWNYSRSYDPTTLCIVQSCDLFPFTIGATTRMIGKELDHRHYHLIKEPILSVSVWSPFRQTSPLLHRFQSCVTRLYEAGIWDHLVRQWTLTIHGTEQSDQNDSMLQLEHFVPVFIVGGYLYLIAISSFADLLRNNTEPAQFNVALVLYAFFSSQHELQYYSLRKSVHTLLKAFYLFGKSKKVVVLLDPLAVKQSELNLLAYTFSEYGIVDAIYVMVMIKDLSIIRLDLKRKEFIPLSTNDSVEQLFPDGLSNLSGMPYRVACFYNPPLTYRANYTNRIVGIDVDFIDIIAKHQSTVAEYLYTQQPIRTIGRWQDKPFDFATYRIELDEEDVPFSSLYFPNQHRWCLAVPKTYNRIIHEQVIWPYASDLWLLIAGLSVFFVLYRMVLQRALRQNFPAAFGIINPPVHLMRILLLFLLSEYYTAMLTAILGQSNIATYPRTLAEFSKSSIPLLASEPKRMQYLEDHPEIRARTIQWNYSRTYDPTTLSLVQLCDLFPFTIAETTRVVGRQLDHHHFHLIKEPIKSVITWSPFRQTSPLLQRFQAYVTRLHEAGIWDHLVRKWTLNNGKKLVINRSVSMLQLEHFIPVYIVGGYLYLIAIGILLVEIFALLLTFLARIVTELHSNQSSSATVGLINFNSKFDYVPSGLMQLVPSTPFFSAHLYRKVKKAFRFNVPLVLYGFHSIEQQSAVYSIHNSVIVLLNAFNLFGKPKKFIVLLDPYEVKSSELNKLTHMFTEYGIIDVIYVLVSPFDLRIVSLDLKLRKFVPLSTSDRVEQLFPDRLSNMSGIPYRVACAHNPPLIFHADNNKFVGIDVDFIDIIAKHQSTVAEYVSPPKIIFDPWDDKTIDLATYRIVHSAKEMPFASLYFPYHPRYCLVVPKTYNRIVVEQIFWPYTIDLWLLVLGMTCFFLIYRITLQRRLRQHFPRAFRIIDTPLHLLRILLLFLLSEYYTAILTASLGQSNVPTYPRTLDAFAKSKIPLLLLKPQIYQYLKDNPKVRARTVEWNISEKYDTTKLSLVQMCDLFPFSMEETTRTAGKQIDHRYYHLIGEPIWTTIVRSTFSYTNPQLHRFQLYITRLHEAGIWDHLVRKWTLSARGMLQPDQDDALLQLEHFIPVFIVGGCLYLMAVVTLLIEMVVHRLIGK
uniref:Ionotropic glutamate receptor L-glutamate and glycine-binding domain-containing protein n=1 Tax=Anopheles albimanus TaxID=7167 RepID=A0A182FFA9_ANOAL